MVTFTKRSTRCLPSKERWLGRKRNHRPRLQEAYQKFCLGFCLCCFNVFPSVLTCTQIGEPNLSCSISWEMQKRTHNFQLERGPMSSKRMDPAFNTLPPPLVVHDPCDASGNATDFWHFFKSPGTLYTLYRNWNPLWPRWMREPKGETNFK